MTDITYDRVAAVAPAPASVAKPARKGFWRTALEAMIEARMRQVERMGNSYYL